MSTKKWKRILITGLIILTVNDIAWGFSGSGSGTETDPYNIADINQLQEMSDDLGAYYVLENDIDASDTSSWNDGAGFSPVGDFIGFFDGQGHTITDLFIDRPSKEPIGLFGRISSGAEIKNVGLIDVDVTGYASTGSLVGVSSGSTVTQCWSSGRVIGTESGFINSRVGGLVGFSSASASIIECFSSVDVTSSATQVGGLTGYNGHGSIVLDSYATGNVTGYYKVGGLVGDNLYPEGGYVKRCYSTGYITGGTGGGLIGYNYAGGVTYESYWDIQTSGETSSHGGTGKTTAEMMEQATFASWDFNTTWFIEEGQSYPSLRFEQHTDVIAHWKFDDDTGTVAKDSAGGNDGVLIGSPVRTTGVINGALQFDGLDDYVSVGDKENLDFDTADSFTLSAWIKIPDDGYDFPVIDKRIWYNCSVYGCYAEGYTFTVNQNKLSFGIEDIFGNRSGTRSETVLTDNKWHQVTAVRNAATNQLDIYVDGVSDSTPVTDITTGTLANSVELKIGKRKAAIPGVDYYLFDGRIDDVRIYNGALSSDEVQQLYQEGRPSEGTNTIINPALFLLLRKHVPSK
ncbi:MAG: LamG domain-containing protein [Candidatus Electrothrix sp. AU1_5]|nr:LamG domain-containing protein [Candidatus Electrothrix gigas]